MDMKKLLLAGAALLAAFGAYQVNQGKAPTSIVESALLYPTLLETLNDAQRIDIASAAGSFQIAREGERWVMADRDNFPIQAAPVRELLMQVASLRIREEKTSRPEQYATLGVEDLNTPKAAGQGVTVIGKSASPMANLLVGKARKAKGSDLPGHYVRRDGGPVALLAEGELAVKAKRLEWMDTAIASIGVDRVRKASINYAGQESVVVSKGSRKEQLFTLQGIPAGKQAKSSAMVSNVGALLLDLRFEDVAGAKALEGQVPAGTAQIETFDGLVATLSSFDLKGKPVVTLKFEFKPELAEAAPTVEKPKEAAAGAPEAGVADANAKAGDVAAEVARLNERTVPWAYQIPEYKVRTLKRSLADLVQPIDKTISATPP